MKERNLKEFPNTRHFVQQLKEPQKSGSCLPLVGISSEFQATSLSL